MMAGTLQEALAQHEHFLNDWLARFQAALNEHAAKVAHPIVVDAHRRMELPHIGCMRCGATTYALSTPFRCNCPELEWFASLDFRECEACDCITPREQLVLMWTSSGDVMACEHCRGMLFGMPESCRRKLWGRL